MMKPDPEMQKNVGRICNVVGMKVIHANPVYVNDLMDPKAFMIVGVAKNGDPLIHSVNNNDSFVYQVDFNRLEF